MLRVGLDLRPTEEGFKAHFGRGTGRYTAELVKRLIARNPADTGCQLVPLSGRELCGTALEQRIIKSLPLAKVTIETQVFLPRRLRRLPVDMLHFFSHGDAPAFSSKPYLTTVLDLIPLRFPELYKADKPTWRFHLARMLELRAIRQSAGILAISKATKRDLIEILNLKPDDVFVTPLAVGGEFSPLAAEGAELAALRRRLRAGFGLPEDRPVLVYVGGIDPRKNVHFMLEVFAEILRAGGAGSRPLLAISGRHEADRGYPRLLAAIENMGLKADVRLLGFVPDEKLPELYQTADLTLFPSLYEGFGFPVLESMACGTPVAAARNSSVPEVTGEEYPLLRDNDRVQWVEEIRSLLASPERLADLRQAGIRRAGEFSWEKTASLTLSAYQYFARRVQERAGGQRTGVSA